MNNLKQEKGSITLFVLIAMLFFVMYLVGMYMLNVHLESSQIVETAKIKEIYEQGVDNIDDVYNTLIGKNQNVNAPIYKGTGLTPVIINSNGTITNVTSASPNWYSYDGTVNHWANAQTKDGSMWVWIPRFAYKITYTNPSDKSAGGTIDVVFLKDTTNNDFNGNDVTLASYVDEKGITGAYIVHPAFRNGTSNNFVNGEWDKEIQGFWMAKFEAGYAGEAGDASSAVDSNVPYSGTIWSWTGSDTIEYKYNYYGKRELGTLIKYPIFQANRASVNFIRIADAYDLCRSLQNANSVYGLSNIDSHLTKNSEWGAVAYLAHSKYGRNGQEVIINNINLNNSIESLRAVTGYGAKAATGDNSKEVTTTWDKIQSGEQEGSWTTSQGQTASTTGNVYGIYDLSGGIWEWIAGYIATTGNYETYGGSLKGESNKYKTKYAYSGDGSSYSENYNLIENKNKIGDAITETSLVGNVINSWNGDFAGFISSTEPFFIRGANWRDNSLAGVFARGGSYGYCFDYIGFRAVLIAE